MMRVLVVDDEPLARASLSTILDERDDVGDYDVANDAIDALEKVSQNTYDVVLLDIRMPEMSGLEFMDELRKSHGHPPAVVFVSAHSEHAIAAFERCVTDYVLKPFAKERVNEALDRASQRSVGERAAILVETLNNFKYGGKGTPTRIAIKTKGQILLIDPSEVLAVEADGNYVLLHRKNGSNLLRDSISSVADKLKACGFVRIHRSVLVNSAHVTQFAPLFSGEYSLTLQGGKRFTVSRTYKKNLRLFAELGIGVDSF